MSAGASAALTARLAVLQRPQTPADLLPSGVELPAAGQGTIIPALTRLVATPGSARLYLAVLTAARGSPPLEVVRIVVELRWRSSRVDGQTVTVARVS